MSRIVGIIGGGQLAKMLATPAINMSIPLNIWVDSSEHIVGNLGTIYQGNVAQFNAFCESSEVIVFEHEHIDAEKIAILSKNHHDKCLALGLLKIANNRAFEKRLFEELAIPHAKKISDFDDVDFPLVFKTIRGGYDGKGQYVIKSRSELDEFLAQQDSSKFICEEFIPFSKECSLVMVADQDCHYKAYDITENVHKQGILHESKNIPKSKYYEEAFDHNAKIAKYTNYVGVFAVEYFVYNDKLYANEISPRVHNSGHWTMDGAYVSQFENHLRASLNLTLGDTASHSRVVMRNLIGSEENINLSPELVAANSRLYLYGKESRVGRKLGHVNEVVSLSPD